MKKQKSDFFEMMPIIMDGTLMNVKVARMLLKELSNKIEGKLTPIEKLKLEPSFNHDRSTYFTLFCMIHVIKNNRNTLFKRK